MAVDNLRLHFHLTPAGWVVGNHYFFDQLQGDDIPRPVDALETWEVHVTQKSQWSQEHVAWNRIWQNDSVSIATRQAALKIAGPPPSEYEFPG